MTLYARQTGNLCPYFNDFRLTTETIVSALPPAEMSLKKAAELRLAKFKMMERGLIGDNFSAVALGCATCKACIPLRINVGKYISNKKLGANTRRNQDLVDNLTFTEVEFSLRQHGPELFALFKNYVQKRHPASLMGEFEYNDFLALALPQSHILTLKSQQGAILAAALLDIEDSPNIESSMHYYYPFYNTDSAHNARSLGTALWLTGIKHAQLRKVKHIYV